MVTFGLHIEALWPWPLSKVIKHHVIFLAYMDIYQHAKLSWNLCNSRKEITNVKVVTDVRTEWQIIFFKFKSTYLAVMHKLFCLRTLIDWNSKSHAIVSNPKADALSDLKWWTVGHMSDSLHVCLRQGKTATLQNVYGYGLQVWELHLDKKTEIC